MQHFLEESFVVRDNLDGSSQKENVKRDMRSEKDSKDEEVRKDKEGRKNEKSRKNQEDKRRTKQGGYSGKTQQNIHSLFKMILT
jgi:hypothetical protein